MVGHTTGKEQRREKNIISNSHNTQFNIGLCTLSSSPVGHHLQRYQLDL